MIAISAMILPGISGSTLLLIFGLGAFLIIIISPILSKKILEPLDKITKAEQEISVEKLDKRINYKGKDTELKVLSDSFDKMIERLEISFNKQNQFISDASHELKTPLAVIEANTDVLDGQVGNNKWISYIQNEIDSMNKLINELLLLAKMENVGELKEYKELDISKETEIIVSMFESMAYEKNVLLKSDVQENIMLNGNKEDVEHILSTLIDNAIKHTEKSKEVIVELKKNKNSIIWQVKNMGEPIPEDEREKIFERFYRIDKSRNRKEKRYGLGLAIAKSTVKRYGGSIEVLYKNGFTIFRVSIPI